MHSQKIDPILDKTCILDIKKTKIDKKNALANRMVPKDVYPHQDWCQHLTGEN